MSRRGPLRFLQYLWPLASVAILANTALIIWAGDLVQANAWIEALPIMSGIVAIMGTAAGGGPLVSDHIKAKAGILEKEKGQ